MMRGHGDSCHHCRRQPPPPAAATLPPPHPPTHSPALPQRRVAYASAGALSGTLLVYRNDLKQLQFDLVSATGEPASPPTPGRRGPPRSRGAVLCLAASLLAARPSWNA